MLRNMSGEGSSCPAVHGVASPGLDGQESSWIGLLSRPAMAFLQRYLPGRPRTPIRSDAGAGWIIGGGLKTSFVDEEREFLRQLDDMMPLAQHPASHLTHLQCQLDGAAGLLEPRGGGTLPWLTADSLLEMGIQTSEELDLNLCQQTQMGYLSSVRTFFSHVLLSSVSFQEMKPSAGNDREPTGPPVKSGGGRSRTWWGSFWLGEESSPIGPLSDVPWADRAPVTGRLCPQQPVAETKAPKTTDLFVQRWTLGENTGPTELKEEPSNNGGLQTVQNAEGFTMTDHRLAIGQYLSGSGAAAACSEVALLTPDQDNGYSSLEEEHFQVCRLSEPKPPSEEQEADSAEIGPAVETEMEEETSAEGESTSGNVEEEEEEEEEREAAPLEAESVEAAALTNPQCQNKAIAFIMGCPCSDDDSSSQSDGESSDDDDDDDDDAGFDSEGSSDQSDSTDDEDDDDEEDDEASDSDVDSEAERLWSSLCQSVDPYNPRNFTARLHTSTSPPRTIPTPPSSTQSTPASSPDLTPLSLVASPPLTSSSPTSGSDFWDDSTSASEVDEAESLRLLSSFSCSSDPYSPFNFQATLRTQEPVKAAGPRAKTRSKKASQTPSGLLRPNPAFPPEYRKEEAEERLDSGFSEPSTSSGCSTTQRCSAAKKVRFCDDVEEFFASCGEEEDRRGPWEELARDRCRFLRRCQEVEQSIAYCLKPQHRNLVYRRLAPVPYVQEA